MMTLRQLLRDVAPGPVPSATVTGLACHSKEVRPGSLFVAVRGAAHDGHAFIDEAVERGACAVVVDRGWEGSARCPVIQLADTRRALPTIAARFYGEPASRLRLIGITGTNGKTTTAYLAKAMIEGDGSRAGLLGTVAYEIGERALPSKNTTPGPLELQRYLAQMVEQRLTSCVMEVSSHALDQGRIDGLQFDAAVFTNLGSDHLDYHDTLERYAQAKRRLFGYLREGGWAVINVDDAYGKLLAEVLPKERLVTFGLEQRADVAVRDVASSWQGLQLTLVSPWGAFPVASTLVGRHNLLNIAAAAASCLALGIRPDAVQRGLAAFTAVPGRMERIANDAGVMAVVDFAHTADALRVALRSMREMVRGRLIVVFGCGGDRDQTKRPAMGQVASQVADEVVLTSDNPRSEDPLEIIRHIQAGFPMGYQAARVVVDREQAIRQALALARPDDGVLIAGKGHEAYQIFQHVTVPFSDRDVVERAFAQTAKVAAV